MWHNYPNGSNQYNKRIERKGHIILDVPQTESIGKVRGKHALMEENNLS